MIKLKEMVLLNYRKKEKMDNLEMLKANSMAVTEFFSNKLEAPPQEGLPAEFIKDAMLVLLDKLKLCPEVDVVVDYALIGVA